MLERYLAVAFALAACAPDVPPAEPLELRVATFNVHRFFDDRCDSGDCGGSSFEALPSASSLAARARQVAGAIAELDAGVILLQEIETRAALDVLGAALMPAFETAELAEHGVAGTLDVAVLARAPVIERHAHRDTLSRPDGSRTTFSRALFEVHLDFAGSRVIVFCAHFRSQRDDDPGRRYAEAEATGRKAAAAAAAFPDALVIAGGDLNDVPGSGPLGALEREGALFRVAAELAPADATYEFDGTPLALDHLYLREAQRSSYVPGSARVHGGAGFGGSDHRALSAVFAVPTD